MNLELSSEEMVVTLRCIYSYLRTVCIFGRIGSGIPSLINLYLNTRRSGETAASALHNIAVTYNRVSENYAERSLKRERRIYKCLRLMKWVDAKGSGHGQSDL
jgi:hypothetical protein